jgi:hypothetical protein
MAKRTKKAKPKPASPEPTRRGRPRQADLPGTEDRKIRALEEAAEAYAEIRDERMQLNQREAELKSALLAQMKKLGKTVYHRDGITITVVAEEETVKVRVKKASDEDDDEDQDDMPPQLGEEFAEERAAAVNAED